MSRRRRRGRAGAARRLRRHPRRAARAGRVPARGARRGQRGGRPTRACRSGTRPRCRSSPSTRPARRTWTRRCSWSARTAATASATPSPTCRPGWCAGGAIDRETRRRGQTIYSPDRSTPLHPETLSEDAASLLPGEARPAFVWDLRLDGDGRGAAADVYRAMVRSVERMDYEGVQARGRRRHRATSGWCCCARWGSAGSRLERPRRREPADAGAGGAMQDGDATWSASGRRCRSRTGTRRSR